MDLMERKPTDVIRTRGTNLERFFTKDESPAERGALFRKLALDARAEDELFPTGTFSFDKPLEFGDTHVTVSGLRDATFVCSGWYINDPDTDDNHDGLNNEQKSPFPVVDGQRYRDMTLLSNSPDGREAACVSWDRVSQPQSAAARFDRCVLIGKSWVVYSWEPWRDRMIFSDCVVEGRRHLAAAASSHAEDQFFDFYRCRFIGDASLKSAGGGIAGHGLLGLLAQGGTIRAYDCAFDLKGSPDKQHVIAAWTGRNRVDSDKGTGNGTIELYDCRTSIEANGSPRVLDAVNESGVMRVFGGQDAWRAQGNVEIR